MSRIAIASAALGVGALSATIAIPAVAETVSGEATPSEAVTKRVESIRDALQGLVDDKTLTDAQADKVADTLANSDALRGPFGHGGKMFIGGSLEAAASALGMSEDDVRSGLRDGKTLAQLAEEKGKNVDDVVAALVKDATTRIDEAVAADRITQERADELKASLEERIRDFVENGKPAHPGGPGGKGMHRGWGGGAPDEDSPATPSPSATTESSSFRI